MQVILKASLQLFAEAEGMPKLLATLKTGWGARSNSNWTSFSKTVAPSNLCVQQTDIIKDKQKAGNSESRVTNI